MSFISDALKNLSNKKADKEVMVPPGINGSEVDKSELTSPINVDVDGQGASDTPLVKSGRRSKGRSKKVKAPKVKGAKGKGVPKVALIPVILIALLGIGYFVAGDTIKGIIFPPTMPIRSEQPQVAILDDAFYDENFDKDDFFDEEFAEDNDFDFMDDMSEDNNSVVTEVASQPAVAPAPKIEIIEAKSATPAPQVATPAPKAAVAPKVAVTPKPATTKPKSTPKSTVAITTPIVAPKVEESTGGYVRPSTPPTALSTLMVENNPYKFNSLTSLGSYALKAGNKTQALEHFKEALKYGESVDLSYNTAFIYIEESQASKAADVIVESKMQEGDLRELFELMLGKGYIVQTESALKKVLRRDNFGDLYYISGLLNEKKESYATASTEYRKAMIRSDFDPFMTYAFARSQDIIGNTEDAKNYYRIVLQTTGDISLRTASTNRLDQLTYIEMTPADRKKISKSKESKQKADSVDSNTRLINVDDYYDSNESEFNIQYEDY